MDSVEYCSGSGCLYTNTTILLVYSLLGRKSVLCIGGLASLLVLSILAPTASALVVGGHSPITILLTSPDGAGQNKFGCTSSGCSCTNSNPCTSTDAGNNFVNELPSSECAPTCVYFVDSRQSPSVTYLDIPTPTAGTWTVQYFGTLGTGVTGEFTITAATCGEVPPGPTKLDNGGRGDNNEGPGTCSVFCAISINAPNLPGKTYSAHVLCDADDTPFSSVTVKTSTVTGGSSGGAGFGVSTNGTPYIPQPITTPEFSYGFIPMVAVMLMALAFLRRSRGTAS